MQIHQVEAKEELRHEVDPIKGMISVKQLVLKPGGARTIAAGDHGTIDISDDGTFEVPEELGAFLIKQQSWYEGPNPLASLIAAEAEAAANAEAPKAARKK